METLDPVVCCQTTWALITEFVLIRLPGMVQEMNVWTVPFPFISDCGPAPQTSVTLLPEVAVTRVLFVNVSVVRRATSVSVEAGTVRVALLELEAGESVTLPVLAALKNFRVPVVDEATP